MKKKMTAAFAVMLAAGLISACGADEVKKDDGSTAGTQTESTSQAQESSTESTPQETAEAVMLKDVTVEDYVTLGEYKGLEISTAKKQEYTQEDVENLAFSAYQGYVTAEAGGIMDRAAENGDIVNIDYVGTMDGVAFDGGTAKGQAMELGAGGYIEGFQEGIVGVKPGETVDLNLTFPDPYTNNPDMAGKEAVFSITVNFIYPGEVSQMVDAGVANMGAEEYQTVDELMAFCEEYMEYMAENDYVNNKQNAALQALMGVAEISEAPAGLVQRYYDSIYATLTQQAAQNMVDVDTYCTYFYQMDAASYTNAYAQASAEQSMAIQMVANLENLNVSDEDLETLLQEFAEENETTVEEVRAGQDEEMLKEYFMFEKVLDFLIQNGNVTES